MTDGDGDGGEPTDFDIYDASTRQLRYAELQPLGSAPYFMPNLIAAIVASVGVVVGCVGPWAALDVFATGGLEVEPWGKVALALGAASAILLFIQLNWSRTASDLRWAVPLAWLVLVAGVGALAIALVEIVHFRSAGDEFNGISQIGWGLWLVAICSVVVCITAPIAATQVGRASELQTLGRGDQWSSAWRWAAIGLSALVMVVAVYNGYKPTRINIQGGKVTATQTLVLRPPSGGSPSTGESLPANARPCPSNFPGGEFGSSAVGTSITSCPFAEAVRLAYLNQSYRNAQVTVFATSPVTGLGYSMSCTGHRVVTCTGGNDAIVYLY